MARGLDIKTLDVWGSGTADKTSDALLAAAVQARDKGLLRYFVKELRISGTSVSEVKDICADTMEHVATRPASGPGWGAAGPPRGEAGGSTGMEKLSGVTCTVCKNVGKVSVCGGCKKTRYCSKACQTSHWKAIHKRECRSNSSQPAKEARRPS